MVAGEVRSLSVRSAAAAREIRVLIQDAAAKVATGAGLITNSGHRLHEIVASARQVSDGMAEIAAVSREQSMGIEQVNRAVAQMDGVVQENTAQTEELSSTSQALAGQARELQELIRRFKVAEDAAPPVRKERAVPSSRAALVLPRIAAGGAPEAARPTDEKGNGFRPGSNGFEEF